jgi:hypothetical protein
LVDEGSILSQTGDQVTLIREVSTMATKKKATKKKAPAKKAKKKAAKKKGTRK